MESGFQEIEERHTRFKHPFTMTVSGSTGAGKSEWIQRLLANLSQMVVGGGGGSTTATSSGGEEQQTATIITAVLYCYGELNANILRMQRNGRVGDGIKYLTLVDVASFFGLLKQIFLGLLEVRSPELSFGFSLFGHYEPPLYIFNRLSNFFTASKSSAVRASSLCCSSRLMRCFCVLTYIFTRWTCN